MNVSRLNRLVEDAYEAAFEYEADLTSVYRNAFNRAARDATEAFRQQAVSASGFVAPPENALTQGMTEAEEIQADRVRNQAAEAIGSALQLLGVAAIGASFMELIAARGRQNFEEEVLYVLRSIVQKGLTEGWTADETALAIQREFRHVTSVTAGMLAQTELTTLVNEQSFQAAQKFAENRSGPLYKVWRTMKDARVRNAHAASEGQTVPISAAFHVGGFEMMYPGDPSAPLSLTARCRCRMSYQETLTASIESHAGVEALASEQEDTLMSSMTVTDPLAAAITITIDDGTADTSDSTPTDGGAWKALLAIEGQATEDGRIIDPGALTWRELPLSLMAMDTTGPGGHEGAEVAGKILEITRDGNDIYGTGVFSGGEFGQKIEGLVGEQSLRGNSVDLAVLAYEYRNAETGAALTDEELMDAAFGESDIQILFAVTEGVILASTICPTPAIAGAEIMLASGVMVMTFVFKHDEEVLTASAAGMAPLHPPLDWFADPRFDAPTALTVTPEGRVMGHAALWNSCHIGEPSGPGVCVPPPRSGMQYEIFHHGVVTTDEGVDVPCGQITMSTFHAGRDLTWRATLEHYENSGCAVADVIAGEDRHGIWVSGGLRPDLPAERVREMKAGALSGDWRDVIGRGLEFLAALVVNIPGFPIPRPEARIAASAAGEEQVLALVAAGIVTEEDVAGMSRREYLRKISALTR